MNTKIMALVLFLVATMALPVQADVNINVDYRDRNIFNHFTDWTVSIGKGAQERQRIIDQRVEWRAQHRREDWERRHAHDHDRDHDNHWQRR